jgi:hypothetical protein
MPASLAVGRWNDLAGGCDRMDSSNVQGEFMKIGLISLSLLCATSLAMAQGAEQQAAEPAATQTQEQAQTRSQAKDQATRKERPRQGGDIRQCLDRKSNKEIHRCAEKQRRK